MPPRLRPGFRIELLASHHDRTAFSCGVVELDEYLRHQAGQDQRRKVAVCHVAVFPEAPQRVLGYYTLATYSIRLGALPPEIVRRLPKYPAVPAALIGRLAVDRTVQGRRLGEHLLLDALQRTLGLADDVGVYAIVVDARSAAVTPFYARFGFQPFPSEPLRLFIPLATVARAFDGE